MTIKEFSDGFDTLVNSYSRAKKFDDKELLDSIEFNEYEKSLFLTKAQEELIINYYNGKNPYGDSFEGTEELRRYLDTLVKTRTYSIAEKVNSTGVSDKSVFFRLPEDLAFITLEQVIFNDTKLGCYNGATASVYPITQDEYNRVKNNPFRGPSKYKVIRLDSGDKLVELVSKYEIGEYFVRYMAKPTPILLEDLPNELTIDGVNTETECMLNSILHNTILERAVQIALQSKGIGESR